MLSHFDLDSSFWPDFTQLRQFPNLDIPSVYERERCDLVPDAEHRMKFNPQFN